MKEIVLGTTYKTEWTVEESHLACSVGSGRARVFSTPMLCALMENAAMSCAESFLEGDEATVGTYIAIEHNAATPCKMGVWAIATLTEANGRELCFEVKAYDECGEIGRAEHKRFVVYAQKFQQKADSKGKAVKI